MLTPVKKSGGWEVREGYPTCCLSPAFDSSLYACLVGEEWWKFCHLASLQHQLPKRKQASESSSSDREAHGHDFDTSRGRAAHFSVLSHYKLSLWLSHSTLSKSEGSFVLDGKPSQLHLDQGRQTWPFITNGNAIQKRNTKHDCVKANNAPFWVWDTWPLKYWKPEETLGVGHSVFEVLET